jgi:hypothetical protein
MALGWTAVVAMGDGKTERALYLDAFKVGEDGGSGTSAELAPGEEAIVNLGVGEGADPAKGAKSPRVVLVQATAGKKMAVLPVGMSGSSADGGK